MKCKKIIISIIVILIILISIFYINFNKNTAKKVKFGNNSSSQEIVNYILNISSYEAKIEVNVKSNKNSNKYILKQQYIQPDISLQEVLEPFNIAGVKIIRKGDELKIENTKLDLTTIINNYEYISENVLDLNCFLENYKLSDKAKYIEEDNEIKMKVENFNNVEKELCIDKTTALPKKMKIIDNNKKSEIYILYNEVNINSLKKENIVAFEMKKNIAQI